MNGFMGLAAIVAGFVAIGNWRTNREVTWVAGGLAAAFIIAALVIGGGARTMASGNNCYIGEGRSDPTVCE